MNAGNLKEQASSYMSVVKRLILHPGTFFNDTPAPEDYRTQLLFALPPVAVFAALSACVNLKPLMLISSFVGAYAIIGVWMVSLRYCLLLFGENRSFQEVLHISACAAISFAAAWIPGIGAPVCVLCAAFLTWVGLLHLFKMNPGAALAAISVPVIVGSFAGGALTYLLLLLAAVGAMMHGGA